MSSFANKLDELVQRVELDPSEFSRLVNKHGLDNFDGTSAVLFAHDHRERVAVLQRHNIKLNCFRVVVTTDNGCFDCDNSFTNTVDAANDYDGDCLPMAA